MQHKERVESGHIDHLHMPTISGDTMNQIMYRLDGIVAAIIFSTFETEQVKYPGRVGECGIVVIGSEEVVQSSLDGGPKGIE